MEGQAWPYVMFVVQGAVNVERYNLEVCDGGQIGAVEYYGCNLFTDTSALHGSSVGILAGLHVGRLTKLIDTPEAGAPREAAALDSARCRRARFCAMPPRSFCAMARGAL